MLRMEANARYVQQAAPVPRQKDAIRVRPPDIVSPYCHQERTRFVHASKDTVRSMESASVSAHTQ